MHWVGSLFLCLAVVLVLLLCMPLHLFFRTAYHRQWHGEVTIQYLWMQHTMPLSNILSRKPDNTEAEGLQQWRQNTSIQIEWKPFAGFLTEALRIITRRSRLKQLEVECRAGFSRPDITAYCYGLFWGTLALLPEVWLARSTIRFQPDFQNVCFEINAKGIIEIPLGKAIGILISLIALWIRRVKAQKARGHTRNREEQIAYES